MHYLLAMSVIIIFFSEISYSFQVKTMMSSAINKRLVKLHAGIQLSGRRRTPANAKSTKIKQLKASRVLQDELYDILLRCDFNMRTFPIDNLVRGLGFSDVITTPDLSFANVFVTVPGNAVQKRQMFSWLCENIGPIRHSLRQRLRHWRIVPTIMFKLVEADEFSEVLAEISSEMAAQEPQEELSN
jgi:ribosome-binding factor A